MSDLKFETCEHGMMHGIEGVLCSVCLIHLHSRKECLDLLAENAQLHEKVKCLTETIKILCSNKDGKKEEKYGNM